MVNRFENTTNCGIHQARSLGLAWESSSSEKPLDLDSPLSVLSWQGSQSLGFWFLLWSNRLRPLKAHAAEKKKTKVKQAQKSREEHRGPVYVSKHMYMFQNRECKARFPCLGLYVSSWGQSFFPGIICLIYLLFQTRFRSFVFSFEDTKQAA